MREHSGERGHTSRAGGGLIKRLFSRESPLLPLILKAQLVFLVGLAAMAFVLPLSDFQRGVVALAAGVLAGLIWAALDHVVKRGVGSPRRAEGSDRGSSV
ncbi:MAG TPA: hypothetical protein VF068_15305 [Rubrobacter sp.]